MAVSVASINDGLLARNSPRQGIGRRKIGIRDDSRFHKGLKSRIRALVGFWEDVKYCSTPSIPFSSDWQDSEWSAAFGPRDCVTREIFKPYGTTQPIDVPPPTYEESIQDLPPDYITNETFAAAQLPNYATVASKDGVCHRQKPDSCENYFPEVYVTVDWSEVEGIRSFANKKAKQAAKKAQQAKWADSDNEDNQSGGADGDEDGNDNGGGDGGSGAGGDAPDGNGGDEPDDWMNGWGSNKKDKVSW